MTEEVVWIIICWILTFILYALIRRITGEYKRKKENRKGNKRREKGRKGPEKTKEKINA